MKQHNLKAQLQRNSDAKRLIDMIFKLKKEAVALMSDIVKLRLEKEELEKCVKTNVTKSGTVSSSPDQTTQK